MSVATAKRREKDQEGQIRERKEERDKNKNHKFEAFVIYDKKSKKYTARFWDEKENSVIRLYKKRSGERDGTLNAMANVIFGIGFTSFTVLKSENLLKQL